MKRCNGGFGVKYSNLDEICKQCDDAMECMQEFLDEQFKIGSGQRFPVETALKIREKPPIAIMFPKVGKDKISFEIYFDKAWLKRQLFGYFGGDDKRNDERHED